MAASNERRNQPPGTDSVVESDCSQRFSRGAGISVLTMPAP